MDASDAIDSANAAVALAEAIRQVVRNEPGIVAISPGSGYVDATYGIGQEVRGVAVFPEQGKVSARVHVVVAATPIPPLVRRLRQKVQHTIARHSSAAPGSIDLYIDDIEMEKTT